MRVFNKSKKYFIDQYSKQAQYQKLRSRSWFKLKEIDHLDNLFKVGMSVIDLGSSPGGWSLYAMQKIGNTGKIIACDKLPMKNIRGVNFIIGDCSDPNVLNVLSTRCGFQKAQIVLSDMSPNTTGISIIDVNKSLYLGYIALKICYYLLMPGGTFLVKIFQGEDFEKFLLNIRSIFSIVKTRKLKSSRMHSREIYIVAKNLNNMHH